MKAPLPSNHIDSLLLGITVLQSDETPSDNKVSNNDGDRG